MLIQAYVVRIAVISTDIILQYAHDFGDVFAPCLCFQALPVQQIGCIGEVHYQDLYFLLRTHFIIYSFIHSADISNLQIGS